MKGRTMFKQIIASLTVFVSGILITVGLIAIDESNVIQNAVQKRKQNLRLKAHLNSVLPKR